MSIQSSRPVVGLLVALIGAAVLTAFAAWAPAAVRKLGLYSVLYGGCVGAVVGWSTREFGIGRRTAAVACLLLTVTGLTLIAMHGRDRLEDERLAVAKSDSDRTMAINIMEAAAERDPEIAADLERHQRQLRPTLTDYLAVRMQALGEWKEPWPLIFWCGEIVLATVAGVVVVRRMATSEVALEEKTEQDSLPA